MMLRILNLRLIFEKILPELNHRSMVIQKERRIAIATEFGDVTLSIAPGRVELSERPPDTRVELTQPQLFSLLFGLDDPPQLPELLGMLFPKQEAVYYFADAF